MKVVGIIPARWASTRFPGKVLANLAGKPMIQHVWERALKCRKLNDVLIACDDQNVYQTAKLFGAKVVMTSPNHISGTDRIAEAVKGLKVDVVINIQGDEPLIDPATIDSLAKIMINEKSVQMATAIKVITDKRDLMDPNVVKVVVDHHGDALYFSRSPIPYNRDAQKVSTYHKHLGIYAYRKRFLMGFHKLPASSLESTEKLEQLRVLEAGYKIKTVLTQFQSIGVDTPEDLKRAERQLRELYGKKV